MPTTSSNVPLPLPPVCDGAVRVVLVRHGRTAWNREHRFLGRTDVPLDEVGIVQARQVAAFLGAQPLAAVYASPLRRAADTAAAIAGVQGLPVRVLDDLVELAQGDLEGQPSRVLPQRYPEFLARWLEDPALARVPGGETLGECQARGLRAIHQVVAEAGAGTTVAVVSHQMVIASVLCGLLGRPLREFRSLGHENGALSILDAVGPRVEVRQLQVVAHLRDGR